MQMSIVERVIRYLNIAKEMLRLEGEKKEIQKYFTENLRVICDARNLVFEEGESPFFTIPVDNVIEYKVCEKTRENSPKVDFERLMIEFPEAYAACTTPVPKSVYIEIRQRHIQR